MKLVLQCVSRASCTVDDKITGEITKGYMILVGISNEDNKETVKKMAQKVFKLRVFPDENGKLNLSIKDVGGVILSISQFTLYADASTGNRPSFMKANKGEEANHLYETFNKELEELGVRVEKGIFGAHMHINLINEGPITIILDSKEL